MAVQLDNHYKKLNDFLCCTRPGLFRVGYAGRLAYVSNSKVLSFVVILFDRVLNSTSDQLTESLREAMAVPALSVVEHPLCYPLSLARQRQQDITTNGVAASNGFNPKSSSPLVLQKSAEDKMLYTYERQRIIDLCNAYAYTLDSTMMDLKVAEDWANLFTDDCVVKYPFGKHVGKAGLSKFGMIAESRFKRMLVSL